MIEHGIFTSKADYWAHLFPLKGRVFWYRREHCIYYIRTRKIEPTDGKSKDGSITGRGFLIPQRASFVANASVPNDLLCGIDWAGLNDRDCGDHAQWIVSIMIERAYIRFPNLRCFDCPDQKSQLDGFDFVCRYQTNFTIEAKGERANTGNLFVQSHEGGHRVHQVIDGNGSVRESVSPAPWEEMWERPFDKQELL